MSDRAGKRTLNGFTGTTAPGRKFVVLTRSSIRIRTGQIYGRLNAPRAGILDEPVDEPAPVIDELTVEPYSCVLEPEDERSSGKYGDLELLELHREDLSRDLFDPRKKPFGADSPASVCQVDETRGEHRAK